MHIRYDNNELILIPDENGNVITPDVINNIKNEIPRLNDRSMDPIEKISCESGIKILDGTDLFARVNAKEIDLSNVDMTNVDNASFMFSGCELLEKVKLSPMSNVRNIASMFAECSALKEADFSPFVKENGESCLVTECLENCYSLENIIIPNNFNGIGQLVDPIGPGTIDLLKVEVGDNLCNITDIEGFKRYNNFIERGYSKEDAITAAQLYEIGVEGDSIKDIVDRHIDYSIVPELDLGLGLIFSGYLEEEDPLADDTREYLQDVLQSTRKFVKDHPEYFIAKDTDELRFIMNSKDKQFSMPALLNILNYHRLNHIDFDALTEDIIEDIVKEDEKKVDLEDLLNKLKSREYNACFCKFESYSLKKSDIYFVDSNGFIRATIKQNKLDERFKRFIKGIQKQSGERATFDEYIDFCSNEYTGFIVDMGPDRRTSSVYTYALLAKQGIIPDEDFLVQINKYLFDTTKVDNPRVVLNNSIKDLWKIYSNNKCWSKNETNADAFFKVASIYGAFSDDRNIANNAMNNLRALTNYIPEKVKVDGYYASEIFDATPNPIDRDAEITIKPGIPYKPKKAHKAIRNILFEDEVIKEMFNNDKDELDKFLKKIEPLSELMDNFSVEDMEDGPAKTFMQRVVANLYVNTEKIDVDVDKRELRNKEALHKFRKLTEKHAGDEDVNFHVLDSYKVHALFSGFDYSNKMNLDFAKFIKNHMRDILYSDNPWKMGYFLSTVQKQWDFIQTKRNMDRRHFGDRETYKMSFREIESILNSVVYDRNGRLSDPKYDEVAELCFSYRYNQNMFEKTCNLYDEMCNRHVSSIPNVTGTCGNYTYKFLALDDPAAIFFGQILDCCQQFGNAGEQCMIHSCRSQNGRVFGVFDENGMMVAGSWTWRNGDTVCFDNVEAANNPDRDNIISVYEQAAAELVNATNENDTINKVTVGHGYSDISLNRFRDDDINKYPIERDEVNYLADSRRQHVLFYTGQDDFNMDTVASYEDPENITHVNASLGEQYSSTAGTRARNRFDLNEYEEPDSEDEFYEERHDDSVIDDDIDDYEIIDRVKDAARKMLEQEEDRER